MTEQEIQEIQGLISQTVEAKLKERLDNSQLFGAVEKLLKYGMYIYNQATPISGDAGEFFIRYPYSELPPNSLLYVLPTRNSIESGNKLRIKFAYLEGSEVKYGNDKYYDILVEQSDGLKTYASIGHIVANRLAIFRVGNADDNTITLINSPLYNAISVTSATVTNDATFYKRPQLVLPRETETDPEKRVDMVTSDQLEDMNKRVTFLEERIQIGEEDPEIALAGYPDGTLYVKVESN